MTGRGQNINVISGDNTHPHHRHTEGPVKKSPDEDPLHQEGRAAPKDMHGFEAAEDLKQHTGDFGRAQNAMKHHHEGDRR